MDLKKICYNCMKEKSREGGFCPNCGFRNEDYQCSGDQLRPLTPLNGKYLLGRALGAGGFGITYIALDLHLQVVVAIKELYLKKISIRKEEKNISVNERDRQCFDVNKKRFLQEARILAMFNEKDNEGVVIVKDHFEENNTAYIVMEYLDGQTLKEVAKKSRLSFEQTRELLEPVCHALIKIHQFGVVHLDVTPDNIMIMPDNRAKLLDFGGAQLMGAKEEHDVIAFKRGYAPPEQYMENGRVGAWTDVYATAATMYYCLTGKKPIDSMERKAGAELKRLSTLGVKISASQEAVLLKALELNPANRYQTMEEFWEAFNTKKKKEKKREDQKIPEGINKPGKAENKKTGNIIAIVSALIAAAAIVVMILYGSFGTITTNNGNAADTLEVQSEPAEEMEAEEAAETVAVGDTMPMTLGTYIFENAADRDFIIGVDGGFGDDGTALVLKAYEDSNENRFFVMDEDEADGFYNLRAAHTNSFIQTSASNEVGEIVRQFAELYDAGTEKWVFIYCGHDDEKDMDEVIIQNAAGTVLAPKDGNIETGTEIVLKELDMEDETQKWFVRWSEKDESEADVIVHQEGDLVEGLSGIYNIASALDGKTSIAISRDEAYHAEPTAVVFYAEWLTEADTVFQFRFVPTGSESRYKIYPVDQLEGENKCLEFDPDTLEIVMRDESDNENQLFRLVYVHSNVYLIQTYNESVLGFDLDENGEAVGAAVYARPYEEAEDSRLESWLLTISQSVGE